MSPARRHLSLPRAAQHARRVFRLGCTALLIAGLPAVAAGCGLPYTTQAPSGAVAGSVETATITTQTASTTQSSTTSTSQTAARSTAAPKRATVRTTTTTTTTTRSGPPSSAPSAMSPAAFTALANHVCDSVAHTSQSDMRAAAAGLGVSGLSEAPAYASVGAYLSDLAAALNSLRAPAVDAAEFGALAGDIGQEGGLFDAAAVQLGNASSSLASVPNATGRLQALTAAATAAAEQLGLGECATAAQLR